MPRLNSVRGEAIPPGNSHHSIRSGQGGVVLNILTYGDERRLVNFLRGLALKPSNLFEITNSSRQIEIFQSAFY